MSSQQIKEQIIRKIDERLAQLREHQYDQIEVTGNQYEELNQALAKVIGVPLIKELEDLKSFVASL
nr:hypothetical protein [Maliibacterium massiliense]